MDNLKLPRNASDDPCFDGDSGSHTFCPVQNTLEYCFNRDFFSLAQKVDFNLEVDPLSPRLTFFILTYLLSFPVEYHIFPVRLLRPSNPTRHCRWWSKARILHLGSSTLVIHKQILEENGCSIHCTVYRSLLARGIHLVKSSTKGMKTLYL